MVKPVRVSVGEWDAHLGSVALMYYRADLLMRCSLFMMCSMVAFPFMSVFNRGMPDDMVWLFALFMLGLAGVVIFVEFAKPVSVEEALMALPIDCVPAELLEYRLWLDEYFVRESKTCVNSFMLWQKHQWVNQRVIISDERGSGSHQIDCSGSLCVIC